MDNFRGVQMLKNTYLSYLVINFGVTWGLWFTVIFFNGQDKLLENNPLFIVYVLGGLLGPILGAMFAKIISGGRNEIKGLMKETIKVKVKWVWYLFAVAVPFLLTIIPRIVDWLVTGNLNLDFEQPLHMALISLPIFIIGGGLEEMGWRGVLLPQLLKKHSILASTIILIPIWATWHLPLWFINGTTQFGTSFGTFVLTVTVVSLLLTILYIETKSIFICIIFHAFTNSFGAIIGELDTQSQSTEWIAVLLKLLICFVLFAWYLRFKHASKKRENPVAF